MENILKMGLLAFARLQLAQRIGRVSGAVKWAALAAVCALGTIFALIVALWLFLIPRIGAEAAALAMAGLFAVLCLVFALAARATLHPSRKTPEDDALAEVKEVFARNKGAALLSAVIAGLAMGNAKK